MTHLKNLPLASITASATNPRRRFDPLSLTELANSFRQIGVLNPILVRPLGDRVNEYELVDGERRFRASKEAGLDSIPAIVREIQDKEVLEIQVTANLHRDDLHPLEEAESYERLLKHYTAAEQHYTAAEIGEKIGKSKSYINKRLQLLALTADAREAFHAGKLDPSTALRLARITVTDLQAKCLKEITRLDYNGDAMSPKAAKEHIERNYMLLLKGAPFDPRDTALCPEAGACATCPKRTGNQKDLFDDVKSGDTCTDPACYQEKVDAWWVIQRRRAIDGDIEIIEGAAADAAGYSSKYVRDGDTAYDLHSDKPKQWGKELAGALKAGKIKPVLLRSLGGEIKTVYPRAEALAVLGVKTDAPGAQDQEEKKRAARKKFLGELAADVTPRVLDKLPSDPMNDGAVWRLLAHAAYGHTSIDAHASVAKRRGWCKTQNEARPAIADWLKQEHCTAELVGFVLELLLLQPGLSNYSPGYSESFLAACTVAGLDMKAEEKRFVAARKEGSKAAKPIPPAVGDKADGKTGVHGAKPSSGVRKAKQRPAAGDHSPAAGDAVATEAAPLEKPTTKFKWNAHDVCSNPDVLTLAMPKGFYLEIQLADIGESNWVVGWAFRRLQGASSMAPVKLNGRTWSSRDKAIGYVIDIALDWFELDMKTPKGILDKVRAWGKTIGANGVEEIKH